jgi:hypothetical protein
MGLDPAFHPAKKMVAGAFARAFALLCLHMTSRTLRSLV